MKKTFNVFLTDMKNLGTNWVAAILIGGLIILPSLYAWFNIHAQWDPYGQTDQIAVGVVNEDEGTTVRDEDIDVGEELVDTLKDNDDMDWQFVDREKAMDKVEYGDYFATIVIPEDFSENLGSVVDSDPEKANVEYYVNEKINAIAPKITEKGAGTVVDQISDNFISTVNGVIFDMFNEMGTELEQDLPDIKQFEDYIFTLEDRLPEIDDTLHDTLSDADDASDIIDKASARMPDVKDTTESGLETIDETTNFLNEAEDRLDEMAPEIEEDLEKVQSVADDVHSFLGDVQEREIDFSEGEELSDKLDSRMDDTLLMIETMEDVLHQLKEQNQKRAPESPDADGNGEADDSETGEGDENGGDYSEETDERLEEALEKLAVLKGDVNEIADNLSEVDDFIAGKKEEVDDVIDELHALSGDVSNRIGDFVTEYKESIEPKVYAEVAKAKDTLGNARGILEDIQTTIPEVEEILSSTDENLDDGKGTLEDVLDEFPYVKSKVNELADRIRDVQAETDVEEIIELLKNDPDAERSFFSEPVELHENEVFPIENYGTGMTPFYTSLAIWVGALLLMSLLSFEVVGSEDLTSKQVYFGRYLTFMAIGILQAVVVTLGDMWLVGVSIASPLWFVLFGIFVSIVFMLIVYTLVSIFGDIGKALAIVLLVLQIAGSGGTYPVAVLPEFYQTISPFLPFTYAVDLLREAVGGIVWEKAIRDIGALALFGIITIVFGAFLKEPLNQQSSKLQEKSKESGLFH